MLPLGRCGLRAVPALRRAARKRRRPDRCMRSDRGDVVSREAQTIVLRALSGWALTTFRAGLALNIISWPVNGLTPMRAFVAGFLMTFSLTRPGTVKMPGPLLRSFLMMVVRLSNTDTICLRERPVFSATVR